MFLLRLRPFILFLIFMVPAIASALLQQAPSSIPEVALRMAVLGINLSSFFAVAITAWIVMLVWVLAPGKAVRNLFIVGMTGAMAFRAWQDSWAIDELNMTGRIPSVEDLEVFSPLFVLHALSSLMMIVTLILLSVWLVRKEKAAGTVRNPLWLTIIQFFVFPVGLFWIQPRVQVFLPVQNQSAE